MSPPFVVSVFLLALRNSLISSFHCGAEAWIPFCSFSYPSFLWKRCHSHRQSPFHSSVCFDPAWDLGCIHPFFRFNCASFYVTRSSSLAQFLPCQFLRLYRVRRRRVAVLVAIFVGATSLFSVVFGAFVAFFFFFVITLLILRLFAILRFSLLAVLCLLLVLPFRLDNELKHFALSRLYHPFVLRSKSQKHSSASERSPC